MSREQRKQTRVSVATKIEIQGQRRRYDVDCNDVSTTGMGIAVDESMELGVGDIIETSIYFDDLDQPIWVVAEVRWIRDQRPRRVGLEFISRLQEDQVMAIRALIVPESDRARDLGVATG